MKEAARVGKPQVAGSTESENFKRIPKASELTLDPGADYVHYTSNNTLFGTEWTHEPEVGKVPLVCDASSDILSHPFNMTKYALMYAGAQKNIGPAGVTMVILRDDMLERSEASLPTMLNYQTHAKNNSLYNTPPVFAIYIVGLVAQHLLAMGGLDAMYKHNQEKAKLLYDCIDSSDFWRGHAEPDSRSLMNVTFRLPNEDLEKKFVEQATAAGLSGLKGHRSVGGLRASIYNAFPEEGVAALVAFMRDFEKKNG
jgi:phosphoserine aminotransferase